MRFDVVTLFPGFVESVADYGVVARAREYGLYSLHTWNPRDETDDPHRTVDDRPFGGGPGMLMKVQPLRDALARATAAAPRGALRVHLGPQGRPLTQRALARFAALPGLILLAGRYEGIDERLLEEFTDEEWSLGDFVLSGGEVAAMAVIDGVVRQLPGALGGPDSAAARSTRVRRRLPGAACRRCCARATIVRSPSGAGGRRWGGPGYGVPTCWKGGNWDRKTADCWNNLSPTGGRVARMRRNERCNRSGQ